MITKGQKINDRYEIIKSIGEGGMANVYLAQDTILSRKVAIKVLRGDLATDEKFIRRFRREAIAASSLTHPNIVEIYDVGEDDGSYYIVMEYIEGKTLKQLLKKRGSLTLSEIVDIMLQLTDGIACAHDSYIIHRDLKPQNIMISDNGAIKITDFGIAVALNSTQLTQTNSVMGSVHYLPPEQASGKGCTTKSDIYSMGILLYELVTGRLPFRGDNAVEIALKHMKENIPSVRKENPNIPQSVENIIIKSTAKNPKNRYDDVRSMYNDLKTCLDDSRKNEKPYKYKFPEREFTEGEDENKKEEIVKKVVKEQNEDIDDTPKEEVKHSKSLFVIGVLTVILLAGIGAIAFALFPLLGGETSVKIPDVTNLSVVDAERALTVVGFKVNDKVIEEYNSEFEKGVVFKTDPDIGRKREKGKVITLYVSKGKEDSYKIENYVGLEYTKVRDNLETLYKMKVEIDYREVELKEDTKMDVIIGQSLDVGTEIIISEDNPAKITLYLPKVYEQYPDFALEGWTVSEVEAFAENHNLTLVINYEENSTYLEGTIIKQSRTGKIVDGASLTITVTKIPNEKKEKLLIIEDENK